MSNELEDTLNERAKTHGNWEENSEVIQRIKLLTRKHYQGMQYPSKEALDMIILKMGRILCGDSTEPDHWKDIAGYAMLEYKRLSKGESSET